MKCLLYSIFFVFFFFSCSSLEKDYNSSLPEASGALEEILIVQDTLSWKGSVGDAFRKQIKKAHPGVINPEPYFKTAFIPAEHFGGIFVKHHFIVIPTTLEQVESMPAYKQLISKKSLLGVTKENTLLYKKKDVYASGQTIVFIVASEAFYLEKYFKDNGAYLRKVLSKELMQHYVNQKSEENGNLKRRLLEEKSINMFVPTSFKVALETEDFLWLRDAVGKVDQSLFVQKLNYTSQKMYSDSGFIALRDSIVKKHIGAEDSVTYMETELNSLPFFDVEQEENKAFKKYAWGLWKMKDKAMGGSFVSVLLKSPLNNDLYYVEGFVYAPGVEKLHYIRKLESIIRTFEPIQK